MRSYFVVCNYPVGEFRVGFRDDDRSEDTICVDTDIEPSNSERDIRRVVTSLNLLEKSDQ